MLQVDTCKRVPCSKTQDDHQPVTREEATYRSTSVPSGHFAVAVHPAALAADATINLVQSIVTNSCGRAMTSVVALDVAHSRGRSA